MSLVIYKNNLYELYNLNGGMKCLRKCPLIGPCFSKCLGDDEYYEALELDESLEIAEKNKNLNRNKFNNPPPRYGPHGTVLARQRWISDTSKAEREQILSHLRRRGSPKAGHGSYTKY